MDDLDLGATIKGFSPGQKIFGRYTLKKILGRGGMGVVWLARDESLERDVAVKLLPEMVAADPAAVRELKRETSRSQQLSHPHILRIYDFAEGAGLCGITMELVEGGTLTARRLDQPGEVFTVARLGPWVRQLGEALAYAHDKVKIVHRDLKPANLMLTPDGDLKIADFGIAASVSDSISRASRQVGSSGTPVYMSPQQMMGEKPAVTDDIYALGATLYELLTGKPPFHSGNVMMQVQNKVPPAIAARREELGVTGESIPPAWEQTIAACLAKEPKDRPQSAAVVAERLGLGGPTTTAPKATPAKSTGSAKPEKPKAERVVPAAPLPEPPQTSEPRSRVQFFTGLAAGLLLLGSFGWYVGVHMPEEKRQGEIRWLEEQARNEKNAKERASLEAQALKLKTDEELLALNAARLANARGGAVIRTTPAGAEVRVGAVALEKSPLTLKDLKLGKYPVKVRLAGHEDWTGEVEVKENEFADLDVTLVRSTGTLSLSTDPAGLEAELSGRDATADLPLAPRQTVLTPAELKLPTGTYDVTFRRAGWADQTKTVSIARAGTAQASATFDPGAMTAAMQAAAFFTKLKADPAVRELPSGLRYKITQEGTGAKPAATSKVKVHYKGYLIDGTVFDSTLSRGEPAEFTAQGTIQGFAEGLQHIGNGGKITLYIPPALGYGDAGAPGIIPAAAVLIFEIEMLEVDGKTPAQERAASTAPAEAGAPVKFNLPGASSRPAATGGTVKVGVLHSLSGTMAISETSLRDMLMFAIDEINAQGGVLGRMIEAAMVDGASNWPLFAEKAKQLLERDKVAVTFGCWTSVSRKSVLPLYEKHNSLLVYPVQYEGEEESQNILYTAETINQQATPVIDHLLAQGKRKFYLLGTDYVYPQTTNLVLLEYLLSKGVPLENIGGGFRRDASGRITSAGKYTSFGHTDYQQTAGEIRQFAARGDAVVISTLNGDTNVPFFREYSAAGLTAENCPVVNLSLSEDEFRGLPADRLTGQLGSASYFQSINTPANQKFVTAFRAWLARSTVPGIVKSGRVISSTMVLSYEGVYLWKAAVEKAGSFDTDKVRAAWKSGISFDGPGGRVTTQGNMHLTKNVYLGETRADGQFTLLKRYDAVYAEPWLKGKFK